MHQPVAGDGRPHRGWFLAFEGGEGAGKSTQARVVERWLAGRQVPVVLTREPGATSAGERLRALLLDPDVTLAPRTEALLYAADRAEHVAEVVRPGLERGAVVISDRYTDSSLAYQGAGRALEVAQVARISAWATQDLVPDLTVLLDLPPTVGLARAGGRGGHDRLEREALDFHERVRAHFRALAAAEPHRYVTVDATKPTPEVSRQVLAAVEAAFPGDLLGPATPQQVQPA